MEKTWRTYVASLSTEQKEKMLNVLLEHFLEDMKRDSDIGYYDGIPEYEDEGTRQECLYWSSCGEPLI